MPLFVPHACVFVNRFRRRRIPALGLAAGAGYNRRMASRDHYERVAYGGSGSDAEEPRLRAILQHVPAAARTVLDAGCGDGRLGNRLAGRLEVSGCDLAAGGLEHCRFPTVQASLTELPYDDGQFDVVICSEVLEHIPGPDYARACGELQRVARGHLLICVPDRECLEYSRRRCDTCGTVFHDSWHVRSLDEQRIAAAFEAFRPVEWFRCGQKIRGDLIARRRLRNRLLGPPPLQPQRQCPLCQNFGGGRATPAPHAAPTAGGDRPGWVQALRSAALRIVPGRPRWLGGLLERG